VDMRLRPSGNSGSLVCSLQGFEKYQLSKAWTWEHQALIRTRCVVGMPIEEYSALKTSILIACKKDDLRQEVSNMREKMMTQLGTKASKKEVCFDIKNLKYKRITNKFLIVSSFLNYVSPAIT